jgi:hypothetical protein
VAKTLYEITTQKYYGVPKSSNYNYLERVCIEIKGRYDHMLYSVYCCYFVMIDAVNILGL